MWEKGKGEGVLMAFLEFLRGQHGGIFSGVTNLILGALLDLGLLLLLLRRYTSIHVGARLAQRHRDGSDETLIATF
jgi:hypothetical protein